MDEKEYNFKLGSGEFKGLAFFVARAEGNFMHKQFALEVSKKMLEQYKEQGGE